MRALCGGSQFVGETHAASAACLDGVAVRAQRDHLDRVVTTAIGNRLDVVHLKDRIAAIGDAGCSLPASGVLATAAAAKWADLTEFLTTRPQSEDSITLSWAELDRIVGNVLDSAVRHHPQWWHGDRSHLRAWRAAGYSATAIEPGRSVTFRRAEDAGPAVSAAGSQIEKPVAMTASSNEAAALVALQEVDPHDS